MTPSDVPRPTMEDVQALHLAEGRVCFRVREIVRLLYPGASISAPVAFQLDRGDDGELWVRAFLPFYARGWALTQFFPARLLTLPDAETLSWQLANASGVPLGEPREEAPKAEPAEPRLYYPFGEDPRAWSEGLLPGDVAECRAKATLRGDKYLFRACSAWFEWKDNGVRLELQYIRALYTAFHPSAE